MVNPRLNIPKLRGADRRTPRRGNECQSPRISKYYEEAEHGTLTPPTRSRQPANRRGRQTYQGSVNSRQIHLGQGSQAGCTGPTTRSPTARRCKDGGRKQQHGPKIVGNAGRESPKPHADPHDRGRSGRPGLGGASPRFMRGNPNHLNVGLSRPGRRKTGSRRYRQCAFDQAVQTPGTCRCGGRGADLPKSTRNPMFTPKTCATIEARQGAN